MLIFLWMALQRTLGCCYLQTRLSASSAVLSGTRAGSSEGHCASPSPRATRRPPSLTPTRGPARGSETAPYRVRLRERSALVPASIASLLMSPFFCSAVCSLFSFICRTALSGCTHVCVFAWGTHVCVFPSSSWMQSHCQACVLPSARVPDLFTLCPS